MNKATRREKFVARTNLQWQLFPLFQKNFEKFLDDFCLSFYLLKLLEQAN
jgi:hypothetical protein